MDRADRLQHIIVRVPYAVVIIVEPGRLGKPREDGFERKPKPNGAVLGFDPPVVVASQGHQIWHRRLSVVVDIAVLYVQIVIGGLDVVTIRLVSTTFVKWFDQWATQRMALTVS